ncbi:hypothetical protein ACFQX6_31155 [Streptosporangium lutulentum]
MQWPTFNVRPYVCGGIGHLNQAVLETLRRAGPRVTPALHATGAALFSSSPLPPYQRDPLTCAFAWGSAPPPRWHRGSPWRRPSRRPA